MPDGAMHNGSLAQFRARLLADGFTGDIADDFATRSVFATDNSVYELPPLAVAFPREPDDLDRIARAAFDTGIPITPRGGGTGTNGQSLTDGICIDCSRYLTKIEEISPDEGYAIVQPGVILDQLNRAAGEHGLFFAPTVSTASRATLGGMAATDASGKGSRIYGRTSDHVLDMEVVCAGGVTLNAAQPHVIKDRIVADLQGEHAEINRVFPVMNRGLTGYNLKDAATGSLVKLLCGSEGTLALTKRLKLRLLSKPKHRALVVFAYSDMMSALRDVTRLVTAEPAAIEFIDDIILSLAQQDPVWDSISGVLDNAADRPIFGLNFVEVIADTSSELDAALDRLDALGDAPDALVAVRPVSDAETIAELWQLRSKCVGLLGRMDPKRQGTPFVEDAAVPAEKLADFVEGFRTILDREGLKYGMFGHADVGCVHVRPALDMRKPEDAAMIRRVSDQVNTLALAHGGLIWGEHGKGFRGEYGPPVYGPRLWEAMCRIKSLFDPKGLLNPGKIAMPLSEHALTALDAVPFRGPMDAQIAPELSNDLELAIKCNGNGQCMGRDFDDAMCPSYKATGDRSKGPKGRATLLRQWARMQSNPSAPAQLAELETALLDSLSDCLGCKACASQCPVKVDIPKMRSLFYAHYYAKTSRPMAHRLLSLLEPLGPLLRASPTLSNVGMTCAAPMLRKAGLVDLPPVRPAKSVALGGERNGSIVLIADSFLASFDGGVLDAACAVLQHLGHKVTVSDPIATGKPSHAIGDQPGFAKIAQKALDQLRQYAESGARLVALEPAYVSMFANEYRDLAQDLPEVQPIAETLDRAEFTQGFSETTAVYTLLTHCTETSANPQIRGQWARVLGKFGIRCETPRTGCCGMAGTFGHERDKQDLSRRLYDLSWADKVQAAQGRVLATGFSCRCQVKRYEGARPLHPVEAIWAQLS